MLTVARPILSSIGNLAYCLEPQAFIYWVFLYPMTGQAAVKKDMAPFQISVKEATSLTGLLNKILSYRPEDRISFRDITKHLWLTTSVESTQKTPSL